MTALPVLRWQPIDRIDSDLKINFHLAIFILFSSSLHRAVKKTNEIIVTVLHGAGLKVYFRSFSLDIPVSLRGIKAFPVHPEERLL
jgi:hypothetical protein